MIDQIEESVEIHQSCPVSLPFLIDNGLIGCWGLVSNTIYWNQSPFSRVFTLESRNKEILSGKRQRQEQKETVDLYPGRGFARYRPGPRLDGLHPGKRQD